MRRAKAKPDKVVNGAIRRVIYQPVGGRFGGELEITGVGVREQMPPGLWNRPQGYDAWLLLFLHGAGELMRDSTPCEICRGGLILWGPGQTHHYGHKTKPWVHTWMSLRGALVEKLVERSGMPLSTALEWDVGQVMDHAIGHIYEELVAFVPSDYFMILRWVEMCFHELGRHGDRLVGKSGDALAARFRDLRVFIENNLHRPVSLMELARVSHLSPSRFSALFRQCHGASPLQYVKAQRIQLSCNLLENVNLPIAEVARRIGYDDPLYFSRLFMKCMGQSPSQWRKSKRQAPALGAKK